MPQSITRSVLIIEDNPDALKSLKGWAEEVAADHKPAVDLDPTPVLLDRFEEMIEWFKARFPKGRTGGEPFYDIVILDIMFLHQRQPEGGLHLWSALADLGIDQFYSVLLPVSNALNSEEIAKGLSDVLGVDVTVTRKTRADFKPKFRVALDKLDELDAPP